MLFRFFVYVCKDFIFKTIIMKVFYLVVFLFRSLAGLVLLTSSVAFAQKKEVLSYKEISHYIINDESRNNHKTQVNESGTFVLWIENDNIYGEIETNRKYMKFVVLDEVGVQPTKYGKFNVYEIKELSSRKYMEIGFAEEYGKDIGVIIKEEYLSILFVFE